MPTGGNEYYELRPAENLTVLNAGQFAINQNGDNELYKIPQGTLTFTVPEGGRVIAYDSSSIVYDSITDGSSASGKLPQEGYIRFLGKPCSSFTVEVN